MQHEVTEANIHYYYYYYYYYYLYQNYLNYKYLFGEMVVHGSYYF